MKACQFAFAASLILFAEPAVTFVWPKLTGQPRNLASEAAFLVAPPDQSPSWPSVLGHDETEVTASNEALRVACKNDGLFLFSALAMFKKDSVHRELRSSADQLPSDLKAGDERLFEVADGVKMVFCWAPPGKATLGSPTTEQERNDDDEGESEFSTKGFWLGKYEVTQAEWIAVMGTNPSNFDGKKNSKAKGLETSRFPVENVSWEQCQGFLEKINARPGVAQIFGGSVKFKLPHEKEWEYACRGGKGNQQPFCFGMQLNGKQANCFGPRPYGTNEQGPYLRRTSEVGAYSKLHPHPWGLCDMHGNVSEWCENLHSPGDPFRVCRGGSWIGDAKACRAAFRDWNTPDEICGYVGFRVSGSIEK
jgi:formylglycine-generating enzyme